MRDSFRSWGMKIPRLVRTLPGLKYPVNPSELVPTNSPLLLIAWPAVSDKKKGLDWTPVGDQSRVRSLVELCSDPMVVPASLMPVASELIVVFNSTIPLVLSQRNAR